MEKAVAWRLMGDLVAELSDKATESGNMNILVRGILSQGQMGRDQVEQRLRKSRMDDEHVLRLVVADAVREERLEQYAESLNPSAKK